MTINTSYNPLSNGYYSLPPSGAANNTGKSTAANVQATTASPDLSAYLLDLSPEAQNYLNSNISSSELSTAFALSQEQQKKIDEIMQKYQNAPYTQETFEQIQADLQLAGLSPDQLAMKEQVKSFNPTQALLEALGSKKNVEQVPPANNSNQYDTQKKNYLQKIIGQFQSIAAASES